MSFDELRDIEEKIEDSYSDLIHSVENQQLKERLKAMRDSKVEAFEKLSSLGCL